jgi:hypothetical protein
MKKNTLKFEGEVELKLWCTIYSNSGTADSTFTDENPAADAADIAVMELRKRLPEPMGGAGAAPKSQEDPEDRPYHNSPVAR